VFANRTKSPRPCSIISIIILTSLLIYSPPNPLYAADLTSSYNILKNEYPEYVQKLVQGGATEAQIESFLVDLDNEVATLGTLNEANFNAVLYDALREVLTWRNNREVMQAMLTSFATEIEYTLTNKELHPNLLPLRNAVMESVLEDDSSSSSGGGGGGGGTQPSDDKVLDEVITQINKGNSVISLSLSSSTNLISLNAATLKKINKEGKTLELKGNGISFRLPPGAITEPTDSDFSISAQQISQTAAADSLSKLSSAYKLMGSVYELSATTDDSVSGFKFNKPITVTMQYTLSEDIPEDDLDVYYYDKDQGKWIAMNGTVDKSKKTITFTTTHFSKYAVMAYYPAEVQPPAVTTTHFTDLNGHWALDRINQLTALGAISGYPDGTFKPDKTISRAEFAVILVKAFKLTQKPGKVFIDTAGHWAKDYISTANAYGILNGISNDRFAPDELITREQIAYMVVKAAGLTRADGGKTFTDADKISPWAREAVDIASQNGIISGYADNTFNPRGNASRAEAATITANALK
jgi:hypothetical protein